MIKTLVFFILWLMIAPSADSFDRRKGSFLDVLFRNYLQGIFFTAIAVYLLVALQIFELFSLLIVYFGVWAVVLIIKGESPRRIVVEKTVVGIGALFDWIEKPITFPQRIQQLLQTLWYRIVARSKTITILDLVTLAIFAYIFWMRFFPRFNVLFLAQYAIMADPYVHLTWTKLMLSNRLFPDGVYPMAYHTLISAVYVFSHLDTYQIVRFMGPIGSSMIVLSFYWFLCKATGNRVVALIGTVALGMSSHNGLPVEFFRHTLALPMEFSFALIFPGLVYLHSYLREGDYRDLAFFGLATACTCMIHTFSALYLALCTATLMFSALLNRSLKLVHIKELLITGLTGGLVGFLPIIFGRIAGFPLHKQSMSWISENIKMGTVQGMTEGFKALLAKAPFYIEAALFLIFAGLALAALYHFFNARRDNNLWPLAFLLNIAILMMLYYGPDNGGFTLLAPKRVELFLSMNLVAGAVLVIVFFLKPFQYLLANPGRIVAPLVNRGNRLALIVVVVFSLFWIVKFPVQAYPTDADKVFSPIEYESAVKAYFSIKKEFPPLTWTLVAPVEQYEEALGYGYNYELWEFNQDYSIQDAANRQFDIPIPTQFVFIFVEKNPLQIWKNNELAGVDPALLGPTQKYYRDAGGRTKLQNSMAQWCRVYLANHNDMTVYFEDDNLIIYKVEHDPLPYVNK